MARARRIPLASIEDLTTNPSVKPTVKFSGRKMTITFDFKSVPIPDDEEEDDLHPLRFTHRDILGSDSISAYGDGLKAKLLSMGDITLLQVEMKLNHKVPGTGVDFFKKEDE